MNPELARDAEDNVLAPNVSELEQLLLEERQQKEHALERIRYLQADFDNYRKQFEKEKQAIILHANEQLVADLLSFLDALEQGVRTAPEEQRSGLELLLRNFLKILEKYGLQRIETIGCIFDPQLHEAVAEEASDQPEGTVIEELHAGFLVHQKVIRPATVKVAASQRGDIHD